MNRIRVRVLFLLLGSAACCLASDNMRTTTFATPDGLSSCPVAIEASWTLGEFKTMPVSSSNGHPQTLVVTVRNRQPTTVRRAVITVYGFPPGTLSTPAVVYPLGQNPAEIGKSLTIARAIEMGKSVTATFSIPELVTVTGINLDALAYAGDPKFERERGCEAMSGGIERVPASFPH